MGFYMPEIETIKSEDIIRIVSQPNIFPPSHEIKICLSYVDCFHSSD